MGILRAQSGRLQDAAVLWRDALDKEPYNSAARLNLAQSFLRTNQPARALAELNTLLSYDPDRLDIRRLIAQLKARLQ
jgi:predicted Zn-dependent protease